MFRDYKKEGFSTEKLVYYSNMLCQEYGTPYEDNWSLLVSIFDEFELVKSENVNYMWATLEAEKRLRKEYGPAYSWKNKK